jgi:hypothetical protein
MRSSQRGARAMLDGEDAVGDLLEAESVARERCSTSFGWSHWRRTSALWQLRSALVVPHVSPSLAGALLAASARTLSSTIGRRYVAGEPLAQTRRQDRQDIDHMERIIKAAVRSRRVGPAHQGGRRVPGAHHGKLVPLTKQALTPDQTKARSRCT